MHEYSNADTRDPSAFDQSGVFSSRHLAKVKILKGADRYRSMKNFSRQNQSHEFDHFNGRTTQQSSLQTIEMDTKQAQDLAKSRQAVLAYLSSVKKRNLVKLSQQSPDQQKSYQSLPPVLGLGDKRSKTKMSHISLNKAFISSVTKHVSKGKGFHPDID